MNKPIKLLSTILISTALLGTISSEIVSQSTAYAATSTTKKSKPTSKPGKKPTGSAPGQSSESDAKRSGQLSVSSTQTVSSNQVNSTTANQSAIYVHDGGNLTSENTTVSKTGDTTSADNSNFFGQNAGVLVTKNSSATISGLNETTDAVGANAIFASGSNAKVTVSSSNIKTSKSSSRGLDATLKGTVTATDTNISTQGSHSASVATDRGGGTVSINKGTLRTSGDGSPILYSTGNISASNIDGVASGAEAAVIEGDNNITVNDSTLTGSKNNGVMLYQSQSGDAETGTASFTMTNGSLTSKVKAGAKGTTNNTGALFYVTNTDAKVSLTNVKLSNASNTLIRLASDRWGTSGKNGGKLTFNANNQTLKGNVQVNKGSSLKLLLKNGSELTGNINKTKTSGTVSLTIDGFSTWNVTGTSHVTVLKSSKAHLKNIKSNGHNVYYDKSNSENSWLNGKTYSLNGGGKLVAE